MMLILWIAIILALSVDCLAFTSYYEYTIDVYTI